MSLGTCCLWPVEESFSWLYPFEMSKRLNECRIINIPRFTDNRGSLSVIEGTRVLPFEPKRFYYLYELAEGARRGCHAHRTEMELIMALAGSFKVLVDDSEAQKEFLLDRPDRALYVPPLVWHEVYTFAAGSVCAVLASEHYDSNDYYYYQTYEEFLTAVHKRPL